MKKINGEKKVVSTRKRCGREGAPVFQFEIFRSGPGDKQDRTCRLALLRDLLKEISELTACCFGSSR